MAVADGAVWVVNRGDRTVSRVDLRTHRVRTIGGVPFADDIAADSDGNLWVSSSQRPFVTRLGGHAASFPDRPAPLEPIGVRPFAGALAVGSGYLWVTNVVQEWNGEIGPEQVVRGRKSVSLVDLRTNRVVRSLNVPSLPLVIAVGYGSAWVGEASRSLDTPSVAVLSPGAASADVIPIRWAPVGMTVGGGSVWVLTVGGTVLRIDPNTRRIVATIPLNRLDPTALEPLGITYGANAVWVTNRADFSVSKINPRTNRVAARIPLGSVGTIPCGIAVTDNTIWVTMDTDVVCGSPANPPG
jgi:YVTN family beta-propeller protein